MSMKKTICDLGSEELNKIWTNDTYFEYLQQDISNITEKLSQFDINRISIFDQLGTKFSDVDSKDRVTLLIFPMMDIVNSFNVENDIRISLYPNKYAKEHGKIIYYPHKNLVLTLRSYFSSESRFDILLDVLSTLNVRSLSKDEKKDYLFTTNWTKEIISDIDNTHESILQTESTIEKLKSELANLLHKRNKSLKILNFMKNIPKSNHKHIIDQLKELQRLDFIQKITFHDGFININIGEVYITHPIDDRPEKIYIGNITFEITPTKIFCLNPMAIGDYPHPHASTGSICFGEADIQAMELLITCNFVELAKILYSWAVSYNPSDPMKPIEEFYDRNNC